MKPIVIDASAAAPWFIPEERSAVSEQIYVDVVTSSGQFRAPSLWVWETSNILLTAFRRRRMSQDEFDAGLALLDACPIEFDPAPNLHYRSQTLRLAQAHGLSFYDASYLELALRLNGQLASLDRALVNAAKNCGIPCLDF
ncbi:type II toxin-antitoxin system VapC family toxin [Variovorax sp. OV329]|uniref:type II toxin-antitoxin system VapC family toxin n=1 Tax=Variovorax sp. OV329 TaxID=1882825 RepID=UPI0008DF3E2D|nr:type II toxin-antitoxin system VapC family toxin [Variovorax sp. OV329]SFM66295.1 Predicted nucleic acid-binding protein, contains PIN domain [Variovorax sp. OV329]